MSQAKITLISSDSSWKSILEILLQLKNIELNFLSKDSFDPNIKLDDPVILYDYDTDTKEALEHIKSIVSNSPSSQILISSNLAQKDLDKFEQFNLFGVIDKPFNTAGMFSILKALELSNALLTSNDPNTPYYLRLGELMLVFQELGNFTKLDDLLNFIILSVTRTIGSERSSLFLADHETNELYSTIAEGMKGKEIRFPIGVGIAGSVAQSKETILIPDPYNDDRFNSAFDKQTGFVTRNILCMPMCNMEGKVIGVIQVLNKKVGGFIDEDIDLLSALCTPAAVSLESTILFNQMEKLVAIKTKDLQFALDSNRNILENIDNGILILNDKLNICDGFSKSCESLLDSNKLLDSPIGDFSFQSVNGFEPFDKKQMIDWLIYGFDNPEMDSWEDLSSENCFSINEKILKITFQRIFSSDQVSLMMVIITDFTKTYHLELEMEKKSVEAKLQMEAILAMTQLGHKASTENFTDIQNTMQNLNTLYSSKEFDLDKINEAFRSIHTLKGHCATIGLKSFSDLIHTEEDFWMDYRNRQTISSKELLERKTVLSEFLQLLESYYDLRQKLFSSDNSDSIQIPGLPFNELLDNFKQTNKADIKKFLLQFKEYSVIYISKSLEQIVKQLSQETNKIVQWKALETEDFIPEKIWKPLSAIFGHLIRNSMDHGIETPDIRLKQNKPEIGTISFSYKATKKLHKFLLKDDGRGIDLIKVKQKAIDKSLIQEEDQIIEKEAIDLLFHPGFTTTDQISALSGRGVGMDAVKQVVSDLNGTISLTQKTGIGLEVTIEIPVS
ncbi:MAG: GAF domain-containing protein [Candidatus Cloacimonetes bacterium]|nr:GAF domain-containing protein [Candidatus Cloacimonadota bacterium]